MALPSPATTRCCSALWWLVVVSSAKQKQQLHHQQLTNGSTILKTFTFPEFLDLFLLTYSIFWIYFSKHILSNLHTKDVAFRRTKEWWARRVSPNTAKKIQPSTISYHKLFFGAFPCPLGGRQRNALHFGHFFVSFSSSEPPIFKSSDDGQLGELQAN